MAAKNGLFDFATFGTPMASVILKNLPYVIFLGFLGTLYIANAHYAENTLREIKQLEKEISDIRWQYMAEKAELMYNSKQSEVLNRVKGYGLSDSGKKPKKIVIDENWEL
jgi:hypothetical protein